MHVPKVIFSLLIQLFSSFAAAAAAVAVGYPCSTAQTKIAN